MIKVVLLIFLFNSSNGEVVSVWQQNGKLPGFESMAACMEVVKNEVPKLELPAGVGMYAKCISPSDLST